jgi:hypothetical protein
MSENFEKNIIKFIKIPKLIKFSDLEFPRDVRFEMGNLSRYHLKIENLDCGIISIVYGFGAFGSGPELDQYEIWIMEKWETPKFNVSSDEIQEIIETEWIRTVYNILNLKE